MAIGLEASTPGTTMTFAPDNANTVNAILLNSYAETLEANETFQIVATTVPVEGNVTYTSSNTTYATVDANGLVTAKATGSANITVTSGSATAVLAITVSA